MHHSQSAIKPGLMCRFETHDGPVVKRGFSAVFHPPVARTAVYTAVVVGTILTLINHGAALLHGHWPIWPIVLTYCVPYAVATYGAVMASRVPVSTGPRRP